MRDSGGAPAWGRDVSALVGLSAAIAAGDPRRIEARLRMAATIGDARAVEETLLQSYLFVGFPATLNALVAWREIGPTKAADVEGVDPDVWAARGARVCRTVYGRAFDRLRDNVTELHPDLDGWMLVEGYGKVLGRPGLSLGVRELCIVALLVAQEAPRQLHSHLRGALHAGASEAVIEAALDEALREVAVAHGRTSMEREVGARGVWARVRQRHVQRHGQHDEPKTE